MLAFPYGLVGPKLGFSVIIRKQSDRQVAVFPQTSGRGLEDGVNHTQGKEVFTGLPVAALLGTSAYTESAS